MNKKWLFLIMAVFVLSGCVVERLNNVISNGGGGVPDLSWDLDFEVPIGTVKAQLSKIEEVNKMLESLKFTDNASVENGESALIHVTIDDMTIDGSTFNVDPSVNEALGLEVGDNVLTWPLPIGRLESPKIDDASFPVIKLDLDGDAAQDMMLTALKSTDGFLKIKMEMQIKDVGSNAFRPAKKEEYFNEAGEPYIAIEDVEVDGEKYAIKVGSGKFSFKPGVYEGGKLVFETSNFLTSYKEAITPEPMQIKDSEGNVTESETDFEYRISIPENAFKIRGRSFSFIEDLLGVESKSRSHSRSRALSRGSSGLSAEEIKELIKSADGDVTVLEKMLTDDVVTLEEVADAYDGNLDEVLADSKCEIVDIMKSDVIVSEENIEILGDKDNGFGNYEFLGDTTLGAIEDAGNLKSLADFCKFYDEKSIAGIQFSFEVEVDLGENFMVTAEFIKDYELAVDTGDSLPLSSIGNILKSATLEANLAHNFNCEMKIKEPKIADKTMKIYGIPEAEGGNGFYTIPKDPCHIEFTLNEMPKEDGGLAFALVMPKNKSVDIASNN
ncbi:MAG: hypothetical protein UHW86_10335 [Spirochaetota bacterium]|nr:hypothetical protein [Spirochaetota bacterium]